MRPRTFIGLLAALLTLLAAVKPLHSGDIGWFHDAGAPLPLVPNLLRQLLEVPGVAPWMIHILLFPLYWTFVRSLFSLFQRFATRYRRLLVAAAALSPSFLPSTSFALDIPAIGLVLGSLALFVSGLDREDTRRVILAGVLAGLAAECQPRGLIALPLILLYARVQSRWRPGLRAAGIGAAVFVVSEILVWQAAGSSPWMSSVGESLASIGQRGEAWLGLPTVLGATFVWAALLSLALVPLPGLATGVAAGLVVGSFLWIHGGAGEGILFGVFGIVVALSTGVGAYRAARGQPELREVGQSRILRFLLGWLTLESVAYLAFAPDSSVPRTQGIAIVCLLILGRSLTMSHRRPSNGAVRIAASLGILLGALYYGVVFYEASVHRAAARTSSERALKQAPSGVGWYAGQGGFALYAELGGLTRVTPGHGLIRAGETLVLVQNAAASSDSDGSGLDGTELKGSALDAEALHHSGNSQWDDKIRFSAAGYQGGRYPLRYRPEPRLQVSLYQAQREIEP